MLLELARVTKTYAPPEGGTAIEVLRGIDLTIDAGEAVAIVGPSGSGKSTLLNLLSALDVPTGGTVRFNGHDLCTLPEPELARIRNREIGLVFQQHHLLPQCTVLENVLLPTLTNPAELQTDETIRRAQQLLVRVGLCQRTSHRPGQLSGGECQRVAVVRALINRPKLVLADEPTGSLDRESAQNLGRLLFELNREEGVALILVTHSMELAALAPRRLELRDGAFV